MSESVAYLQTEIKKELPRGGTGILRGTVFNEVRGTTLEGLRGVVASPLKYAIVVEKGRRPGRMPPVAAIELWAKRVIGQSGLGFVIARAIGRRGTKPQPVWEPVGKRSAGVIQRIWARWFRIE